jgi:hypothetical protein
MQNVKGQFATKIPRHVCPVGKTLIKMAKLSPTIA